MRHSSDYDDLKPALILIACLQVLGCRHDSNSSNVIHEGVFVDSAVEGLHYSTESLSGTTDSDGTFTYKAGETVTFSIGNLTLGSAIGASTLSPIDLTSEGESTNRYRFWNNAILLQSLDTDANPENGITLSSDTHQLINEFSPDLTLAPHEFSAHSNTISLVQATTSQIRLVSPQEAIAHYEAVISSTDSGWTPLPTKNVFVDLNLDAGQAAPATRGVTVSPLGASIGRVNNGNANGYPSETITITSSEGNIHQLTTTADQSAKEIAEQLEAIENVSAIAYTRAILSDLQDGGSSTPLTIHLNNQVIGISTGVNSLSLQSIADTINNLSSTVLPEISTIYDSDGEYLHVISNTGEDLSFQINSTNNAADTIKVAGQHDDIWTLTGNRAEPTTITVGGTFQVTLYGSETTIESNGNGSGLFAQTISAAPFITNSFDPGDESSYNHATSTTIFDSLGHAHSLKLFFVREEWDNVWTMYTQINGRNVGDPNQALNPPLNLEPTEAACYLTFDQEGTLNSETSNRCYITYWNPKDSEGNDNGALTGHTRADGAVLPIPDDSSLNSNFEIVVTDITQSEDVYEIREIWQDGWHF